MCVHVSTQGPPGELGDRGEPGDEGYQVVKNHEIYVGCISQSTSLLVSLTWRSVCKSRPHMLDRITKFPVKRGNLLFLSLPEDFYFFPQEVHTHFLIYTLF